MSDPIKTTDVHVEEPLADPEPEPTVVEPVEPDKDAPDEDDENDDET